MADQESKVSGQELAKQVHEQVEKADAFANELTSLLHVLMQDDGGQAHAMASALFCMAERTSQASTMARIQLKELLASLDAEVSA